MSSQWRIAEAYRQQPIAELLADLDKVFRVEGELVASDPLSDVLRIECQGQRFYLKRYHGAGKGLRRYLGRPRVKAEWQNLKHFAKLGIATAELVGWGLERRFGCFVRGALVTAELPGTEDLAALARRGAACLQDRAWVDTVSRQVADYTRRLHDIGFAHNDLKWRNLLVDAQGTVFFIDCPTGNFWWGPPLRYRIIKDLACLDKLGKQHLSRTQRLRFFLQYRRKSRLTAEGKRQIIRILQFFKGRE